MSSCEHSVYFFFFVLSHIFAFAKAIAPRYCGVDSIYNFGDSLSDTGNLVRESPIGLIFARFPYGETIGEATGRPSDGLLMIDFFALNFMVPLLPPYLNKNASFVNGVNFAVSGATALDVTFLRSINITNPFTNRSLSSQLNWFNTFKCSLCSTSKECRKKFKRSLFFVGEIGGNDFNYALLASKPIEMWKSVLVPRVVRRIISATEELIKAGAAHLIIPGNLPFGCSPYTLTTVSTNDSSLYDEYNCLKPINDFSQYYNQQLKTAIYNLRIQYPSVDIFYADYYNAFMGLLKNADQYGFDRSTLRRSCCGVGGQYNFDLRRLCGTPEATVCQYPSTYIFWDGIHLTQEANRIMTEELLSQGFIDPNNEPLRHCGLCI